MPTEVVEFGPFPEPDIGYGEECVFIIYECNGADRILLDVEPHANNTGCIPSHDPHGLFVEPEALPEPGREDDFPGIVCHDDVDKLVSFLEPDRVRSGRPGVGELGLRDLDDLPEFCREHEGTCPAGTRGSG